MSETILINYGGMFIGIAFLILIVSVIGAFTPRRSRNYRKDLTNLYVAGKIRQIAKNAGVDLGDEYEAFKKFCKKQRINETPLDVTIEEELQDEIGEIKIPKRE